MCFDFFLGVTGVHDCCPWQGKYSGGVPVPKYVHDLDQINVFGYRSITSTGLGERYDFGRSRFLYNSRSVI